MENKIEWPKRTQLPTDEELIRLAIMRELCGSKEMTIEEARILYKYLPHVLKLVADEQERINRYWEERLKSGVEAEVNMTNLYKRMLKRRRT